MLTAAAVAIAPSLDTLAVGEHLQLTAVLIDAAGGQSACGACAWASSDTTVAIVSGTGLLTAMMPGSAAITASTSGGASATDSVWVRELLSAPPGAVTIQPGDDLRARVDSAPPGTAFTIQAGVHRLTQTLSPKDGMSFTGEPGAVLSGAQLLNSFTREGRYWVASGQTQLGKRYPPIRPDRGVPICEPEYPRCTFPEDFFMDDVKLRHVASLSEVRPGTWYFDYEADKVYFQDDPTGRKVETTVSAQAFRGTAANVVIRNLVIEKFATPLQDGSVSADSGSGWIIEDNEVRWNHGIGILTGTRTVARRNLAHHNQQLGMGGIGDDAVVEDNEIAYNNNPDEIAIGWGAGGTKWHHTRNLVLRRNYVHHNMGPGLWTDIDNINTLVEYNRVDNNSRSGIFHEISYDAVIRFNTAARNGFASSRPVRGGGIQLTSSPNVEIYGNTLVDNHAGFAINQDERGSGDYGPYEVRNLHVHDNTVTLAPGSHSGLAVQVDDESYYTSKDNRFERNTYHMRGNRAPFWWMGAPRTAAQWQAFGQDMTGAFHP